MKLHEVERYDTKYGSGYRRAIPGGWLYVERNEDGAEHSPVFAPDPTAEHVTHGAGGAAAEAIYRDAVDHCWKVVNEWAKRFGAPLLERAELHDALKALRFDGSTSQTGEG